MKYQCGSCEQEFNKLAKGRICPKCKSGNWLFGCIDEPEPKRKEIK
jgi:Zn finger protein HypA/HybF involved in hydrogenase expression